MDNIHTLIITGGGGIQWYFDIANDSNLPHIKPILSFWFDLDNDPIFLGKPMPEMF